MIGNLGRRAIEAVVLLFALLGFAFVPLGKHTMLEHVRAILATGAAADAGREIAEGVDRLKRALLGPAGKPGKAPADAKLAPAREARDAGADASQAWPSS